MIIDDTIIISKYNPLAGKSDIKLQKKLDHSRKGLINNQNGDDNIALNGVCSHTYTLQIITQQELQKLTKILKRDLISKM